MPSQRHRFPNANGQELAAYFDLPDDGQVNAYGIFAHCFTCGKNLKPIVNIDKSLTNHGLGILRFDFTGIGESEGDFPETNFSTTVDDLIAAANFLSQN